MPVPAAPGSSAPAASRPPAGRQAVGTARPPVVRDLRFVAWGAGTGVWALAVLLAWLAGLLLCPLGIGLRLLKRIGPAVTALADNEHRRAGTVLDDPPAEEHGRAPGAASALWALTDPAIRRRLLWLTGHALLGPVLLVVSVVLWGITAVSVTTVVWWWTVRPVRDLVVLIPVTDPASAGIASALGLLAGLVAAAGTNALANTHARFSRHLLTPDNRAFLRRRIATLTETRAAALDAQAAELRRIERDLHDGAQAQLIALRMLLGRLDTKLGDGPQSDAARQLLEEARGSASHALTDLRHLVRGIHPPILTDRGLAGAVAALAQTNAVTTEVTVHLDPADRLSPALESAAYFIVAEALTNVARHSGAQQAHVRIRRRDEHLILDIHDDGRGGADARRGTGLRGIERRAEAFDGLCRLTSPPGGPTRLTVELPCAS